MQVSTDAAIWFTPPTRAIWLPAGVEHEITMQGEVAMRTLYIDAARAQPLPRAPRVMEVSPLLRELVLHVLAIGMLAPANPAHDRIAGLLIDLMEAAPAEDMALPLPRDARALKLSQRLHADPADRRELGLIAAEVGAGLRTLQRIFPRETGLTLEAWRQRARLLHAASLLACRASVTESALSCGYDSPAAFSAAFQRHFGVSPGRYARQRGASSRV